MMFFIIQDRNFLKTYAKYCNDTLADLILVVSDVAK